MIVVSTQRTVLRTFCQADAAPMSAVFGDPDVMRFGDGPQDADWIQQWIEQTARQYEQWNFGPWAVVLRQQQTVIGYCGLVRFDDINGQPEVELGYRLARNHWGCGLATEIATAVRDLACQKLGIGRLISLIDPGNHRSIRAATKIGMVCSGEVMLPGYTHPDLIYTYAPDPPVE